MKVLTYSNCKQDPVYWDISTPEKEEAGFRCLFRHLDENWHMFQYDISDDDYTVKRLKELEDLEILLKDGKVPELFIEESKKKLLEFLPRIRSQVAREKEEMELAQKAKAGDYKSIRRLLRSIQGGEYAEWSIIDVIDPLEN
jgi:hypothetical protein